MVRRQEPGHKLQLTPTLLQGTGKAGPAAVGADQLAQGGAAGMAGAAQGAALEAKPHVAVAAG